MSVPKFILVEWIGENAYTVLTRNGLCNSEDKLKPDDDLIDETVRALFNKKEYDAKVLQCGAKVDLTHEMKVLTEQQRNKSRKRKEAEISRAAAATDIDEVLGGLDDTNTPQNEQNWKELYENGKTKLETTEKELKSLKRKYTELQSAQPTGDASDDLVNIGNRVTITSTQLSCIFSMSTDACKFARNLLRAVFTREELTKKSLFGNWCNANKAGLPLPAIDSSRRDAVLDYTYRKYGCSSSIGNDMGRKAVRSKVTASLSDMLRKIK